MKQNLLLLITLFAAVSIFSQDLTLSLVAYYPFNGNANDESGNGNNGIVYGASPTTDRFGNTNSAYYFDGIDDYININDDTSLDFTTTVTMCAWIQTVKEDNPGTILCKYGDRDIEQDRNGYMMFTYYPYSPIDYNFHFVLTKDFPAIGVDLPSATSPIDGNWHFVAGVYDGMYVRVYLDGKLESEEVYSSGISINDFPLKIGYDISPDHRPFENRHFAGKIDDIRLYNRSLSETEINALYHDGGWEPQVSVPDFSTHYLLILVLLLLTIGSISVFYSRRKKMGAQW